MKFLISLHINPAVLDALTDEEKAGIGEGHGRFIQSLKTPGADPDPGPGRPVPGAVVRVRNNQPVVTDGPFLEARSTRRLLPGRRRGQGAGRGAGAQIPDAAIDGSGWKCGRSCSPMDN